MTDGIVNLRKLVEKTPNAYLSREVIGCAAERPMELEVGTASGAGYGEKNPLRLAKRDGYRERDWETRAGTVELRIPKLRKGSYSPSIVEPRRISPAATITGCPPSFWTSMFRAHIAAFPPRCGNNLRRAFGMRKDDVRLAVHGWQRH